MRVSLVKESIHISIYIVIYKYTFYTIIMMGFRQMSSDLCKSVSLAQFKVISSENQ